MQYIIATMIVEQAAVVLVAGNLNVALLRCVGSSEIQCPSAMTTAPAPRPRHARAPSTPHLLALTASSSLKHMSDMADVSD
jgi:hypothetical protein